MGKSPLNKYKKFYNNSYVQNKRGGGLTPRPPPPLLDSPMNTMSFAVLKITKL